MGFFGAVFAFLTMLSEWHIYGVALALPFGVFGVIGIAASTVIRLPGDGIKPSDKVARAILWSSICEGVGLFIAVNIVINLHRPDLLLPAMALIVGLHFLPIAYVAAFQPFYILGTALILAAFAGLVVGATAGGVLAGFSAAGALWLAACVAVRRDWQVKHIAGDGV